MGEKQAKRVKNVEIFEEFVVTQRNLERRDCKSAAWAIRDALFDISHNALVVDELRIVVWDKEGSEVSYAMSDELAKWVSTHSITCLEGLPVSIQLRRVNEWDMYDGSAAHRGTTRDAVLIR